MISLRPALLSVCFSLVFCGSGCFSIFDEGNFNDQNKLKRWMQDETFTVLEFSVRKGQRQNRSQAFTTVLDTVYDTGGTVLFSSEGSPMRDMIYTAADGTVSTGSWSVEDNGDDDDFHLEFWDLDRAFHPIGPRDRDYEILDWGDEVLHLSQYQQINRDEEEYLYQIILTK